MKSIVHPKLKKTLLFQSKMILGAGVVTVFFSLIWKGRAFTPDFWFMFAVVVVQMEIFMFIAGKIFNKTPINPNQSYKKQMLTRLGWFYLFVLFIGLVILFGTIAGGTIVFGGTMQSVWDHFFQYEMRGYLLSVVIGFGFGALLFFYFEWNNALKRENKLREEKLIFQYETLKNQVNPHFLFNSLNTLSSLVSTDAQLAEQFIAKLSTIYRYIIENRDVDMISLPAEIDFVRDYFFLQKIRDNGKIELNIDIPEADQLEVLPISIQLLTENALKHNAATREKPLGIRISREEDYIVVQNEIRPKMHLEPSSNLGLKNLSERVNLVMGREVLIGRTDGKFIVKIPVRRKK